MTEHLDIYTFAREVLDLSIYKGFDRPTWENVPSKLMFVVSEIDEAECVKWRGELAEELADIALRTLAILSALWDNEWSYRVQPLVGSPESLRDQAFMLGNAPTLLWPLIRRTTSTLTAWRDGRRDDVRINLEFLLRDVWNFASSFGFKFEDDLRQKHERNKLRPHLHDKKESAG